MKYVKRSFLRYIGTFLAVLFISYVLSFILNILGIKPKNLLLDNVYALNSGYASSSYDVAFVDCGTSSSNPQCGNTWGSWAGRQNVGVRIVNPYSNSLAPQTRYSFRLVGSSTYTYIEGNTYTWNIVFSTSYDSYEALKTYYRLDNLVGNTSTSSAGASSQYFKSYTYSISRDGTSTNRYVLKISFEPNANLRYVNAYFYINSTQNRYLAAYGVLGNVTYNSTTITYEQGLSSAIANQNTILTNGFENIANISLSNTQNIIQGITSSTNETNDLIKDDSIDTNSGNDFFDSIETNQHGITDIITAPLSFIQSFATESCSPISTSVFGEDFTIPCMKQKEIAFLGQDFYNIIVILVNGPLVYAICTYFVRSVKHAQDPDDDRIEVADL